MTAHHGVAAVIAAADHATAQVVRAERLQAAIDDIRELCADQDDTFVPIECIDMILDARQV